LAFLLAIVVLVVPPLVRAHAPALRAPESSSSFRLNRGFDMPESKWRVAPSIAETLEWTSPEAVTAGLSPWQNVPDATLLPDHRYDRSPDPLRGPPSFLIIKIGTVVA
jgi:hypothetical protein